MMHDSTAGFLRLKDWLELITKIAELSSTNSGDLPDESRFLLEIDTNQLAKGDVEGQDYWVHAMEAAITAGRVMTPTSLTQPALRMSPALGQIGKFLLLQEIRKERSLRVGNNSYTRHRKLSPNGLQVQELEAHRMAALASNRRWKPD